MNMNRLKSIIIGFLLVASAPVAAIKHEIDASVVEAVKSAAAAINTASVTIKDVSKNLSNANIINRIITKSGYTGSGVGCMFLGLWCVKETIKDWSSLGFSPKNVYQAFFGKKKANMSEKDAKEFVEKKRRLLVYPACAIACMLGGRYLINYNPSQQLSTLPKSLPGPITSPTPIAPKI